MMAEPKPFASLTSGLLARKGAATPAMRRQVMLGGGAATDAAADSHGSASAQDDLGWNDMGEDAARQSDSLTLTGLTPMGASVPEPVQPDVPVPAVVEQRRVLAEKVATQALVPDADPAPVAMVAEPAAMVAEPATMVAQPVADDPVQAMAQPRKAKAAFTLRLDAERHLRLRLACAVSNRSAQQIVTQALDAFLDSQPQIEALAEQLPRSGGANI